MSGHPFVSTHVCNARCRGDEHADIIWLRPEFAQYATGFDLGGIVRAILSVILHHHGWRVARFERAAEPPPCPWREHTDPWLVWVEPCPDCGPPTCAPFARPSY